MSHPFPDLTQGPLSLGQYMKLCAERYYNTRPAIGPTGDFITAPEISSLFGEMLGLWGVHVWQSLGAPATLQIVELGPGRGTLLKDMLGIFQRFCNASLSLHLLETSAALEALQREALGSTPAHWHRSMDTLEATLEGPVLFFANEFFDALPIEQYVYHQGEWHQRMVDQSPAGLFFFLKPVPAQKAPGHEGEIREVNEDAQGIFSKMRTILEAQGGGFLIADYGYKEGHGDTLQALWNRGPISPLEKPGESDITAHVDFGALTALLSPAFQWTLTTQKDFLEQLGFWTRVQQLLPHVKDGKILEQAAHRLTHPQAMGHLFQVLTGLHPGMPR